MLLAFVAVTQSQTTYDPLEGTSKQFENFNYAEDEEEPVIVSAEPPPETSTTQALRNYFDLLFIDWGEHYSTLSYTEQGRNALSKYVKLLSAAYVRALRASEDSSYILGNRMHQLFRRTQMWTTYDYNQRRNSLDSDVLQTIDTSNLRFGYRYDPDDPQLIVRDQEASETMHSNYHTRHFYNSGARDPTMGRDELRDLIRLRVPMPPSNSDRHDKPYVGWQEESEDKKAWHGHKLQWNHILPYSQMRFVFEVYIREWVNMNQGRLRTSEAFLIEMEIRMSRIVLLDSEIRMRLRNAEPQILSGEIVVDDGPLDERILPDHIREILTDNSLYADLAQAYNAWPASNIFVGPPDVSRFPKVSHKFELAPAKVIHGPHWAKLGLNLAIAIIKFKMDHDKDNNEEANPELFLTAIQLCERYVRLMRSTRSSLFWRQQGQGFPAASISYWDVDDVTLSPQQLKQCKNDQKKIERSKANLKGKKCFVGPKAADKTWDAVTSFTSCAAEAIGLEARNEGHVFEVGADVNDVNDRNACLENAEFFLFDPTRILSSLPFSSQPINYDPQFDAFDNSRYLLVFFYYLQQILVEYMNNQASGKKQGQYKGKSRFLIYNNETCKSNVSINLREMWKRCSDRLGKSITSFDRSPFTKVCM